MEVKNMNPVTVNQLTKLFHLKLLGVKEFSKEHRDSVVCVGAVSHWTCLRERNKRRVMLTVSPHGLELAENTDGFWKPIFHHTFEEITFIYNSAFATRVFAYTARSRGAAAGTTARVMCIGMKVKRFSGIKVDDIHRAYEAAFEYIREMKSESLHKLLSGLITGLRRAAITTEGEARQQMKTKSTTSLQVQDPPSRFSQPQSTGAAASDELPRKQPSCPSSPESQGAAITSSRMVSVRVPHCSHAQCTKCAGHTSCRHCACTSCRRERYRHRYRREAEVMPNPQHGRPSKEDGESKSHEQPLPNTEPRKKLKTRHSLVSCTRGTEAQPASPEGPADQSRGDLVRTRRPASREEIQYMAKQVATAVLKDKQQRSQSPPQMAQEEKP